MARGGFSANGSYQIDIDASVQSQNRAGNYSIIYWRLKVIKDGSYGHMSTTNNGSNGRAESSTGQLWDNGNIGYEFRNGSSQGEWTLAEGTFRVNHDHVGRASYYVSGWLNLHMLGSASATTGWRTLPSLATYPPAPRSLGISDETQTSMTYRFQSNGDGGAAIREWQVGYSLNPNGPQSYIGSWGTANLYNLNPGSTYYFWSRGRNDVGWSPWSSRSQADTLSGARFKDRGVWRNAIPYVRVNGVWRIAQPYFKDKGVWRRCD